MPLDGGALSDNCREKHVGGRLVGDRDDRASIDYESNEHVELAGLVDELVGTVDRIDDPDPRISLARFIVDAFLGQKRVTRKGVVDGLADDPVCGKIGIGNYRTVFLDIFL